MPSVSSSSLCVYIQKCVSEVPPGGSGNEVRPSQMKSTGSDCPSPQLAKYSPHYPVPIRSPIVLKALTKFSPAL